MNFYIFSFNRASPSNDSRTKGPGIFKQFPALILNAALRWREGFRVVSLRSRRRLQIGTVDALTLKYRICKSTIRSAKSQECSENKASVSSVSLTYSC